MEHLLKKQTLRRIDEIIIHCSYTPVSMDIGVKEIRRWHTEERNWSDIGYHFVQRRSGLIEVGRPIERAGAHTIGRNAHSIGICMVGGKPVFNFTQKMITEMQSFLNKLKDQYPNAKLSGHNEHSSKPCPKFDVRQLFYW